MKSHNLIVGWCQLVSCVVDGSPKATLKILKNLVKDINILDLTLAIIGKESSTNVFKVLRGL